MATRSDERIEFLADILVTAVEGGTDYWSEIKDYVSPAEDARRMYTRVSIREMFESGETETIWYDVTIESIARGIARILDRDNPVKVEGGGTIHNDYIKMIAGANHINDACDIDASLADLIMQAAVLGVIRYG
jgi:hypothetical protein